VINLGAKVLSSARVNLDNLINNKFGVVYETVEC